MRSKVVNRCAHARHSRRRRIAEPSSAIRESTTLVSSVRQEGQNTPVRLSAGATPHRSPDSARLDASGQADGLADLNGGVAIQVDERVDVAITSDVSSILPGDRPHGVAGCGDVDTRDEVPSAGATSEAAAGRPPRSAIAPTTSPTPIAPAARRPTQRRHGDTTDRVVRHLRRRGPAEVPPRGGSAGSSVRGERWQSSCAPLGPSVIRVFVRCSGFNPNATCVRRTTVRSKPASKWCCQPTMPICSNNCL